MSFPTFEECWQNNTDAHRFTPARVCEHTQPSQLKQPSQLEQPSQLKGSTGFVGSFKCCLIGIIGADGSRRKNIRKTIANHNATTTLLDVVTTVELGFNLRLEVFKFAVHERVVVSGEGRLHGKTGIVVQVPRYDWAKLTRTGFQFQSEQDLNTRCFEYLVAMDATPQPLESGMRVMIIHPGSPHDRSHGTTTPATEGVCSSCTRSVHLDTNEEASVPAECVHALCYIHADDIIRATGSDGLVPFTGDDKSSNHTKIREFDQHNTFTPKVYSVFCMSMQRWADAGQKRAVYETICSAFAAEKEELIHQDGYTRANFVEHQHRHGAELARYMARPDQQVRFTVQENAGMSVQSIIDTHGYIWTESRAECEAFIRAVAVLCRGVSSMHAARYMHRDVQPGNVTLAGPDARGEFVLKLVDFDRLKYVTEEIACKQPIDPFYEEFNALCGVLVSLIQRLHSADARHKYYVSNRRNDALHVLRNRHLHTKDHDKYAAWAESVTTELERACDTARGVAGYIRGVLDIPDYARSVKYDALNRERLARAWADD